MMAVIRSNEASRRVVAETRRLYSELLSKPLDEKQLIRPTFKIIQEITKSLITETRTLRNVFNPSDFETENKSWDRRRKCEFVQRLIDFAANHKQPVVGCVADKLVIGLEPNKTNELLQSLAKIASNRLAGQDNNSARPRTFTKRSPQPSTKQANDDGGSSRVTRTSARASVSGPSFNKSSPPPRGSLRTRRQSSVASSNRDASAGSGKVGLSSRRNSQTASESIAAPVEHAEIQSDTTRKDSRYRDSVPANVSPTSTNIETPPQLLRRQSPPLKPTISPKHPIQSSQDVIVSESEINKNIQQLRSNLDQLQSNLSSLSQFDSKFRVRLLEYNESPNM